MASSGLSSLTAHLHHLTDSLPAAARQNPRAAAAVAVTALAVSLPTFSYVLSSYRGYLALGKGGPPYNVLGWAAQGILQLVAKWDTRDPSPFTKPANRKSTEPHGSKTFFAAPVPERRGDRPEVPGYVAPQRQMDQRPGDVEVMRERMRAYLESLATKNAGVLVLKPSALEGVGTPAVWLDGSPGTKKLPGFIRGLRGETAHIHPEASSHVTMSMADAEQVVRKGWAERHRLSGVWPMPWSYVLVYAPRDEGEYEVWESIVRAGIKFVCASAEREVDVGGE